MVHNAFANCSLMWCSTPQAVTSSTTIFKVFCINTSANLWFLITCLPNRSPFLESLTPFLVLYMTYFSLSSFFNMSTTLGGATPRMWAISLVLAGELLISLNFHNVSIYSSTFSYCFALIFLLKIDIIDIYYQTPFLNIYVICWSAKNYRKVN